MLQNQPDQPCKFDPSASTTGSVNNNFISLIVAFAEGCQSMRVSSSVSQYFLLQSPLLSEKPELGKSFVFPKDVQCSHCTYNENHITDQLCLFTLSTQNHTANFKPALTIISCFWISISLSSWCIPSTMSGPFTMKWQKPNKKRNLVGRITGLQTQLGLNRRSRDSDYHSIFRYCVLLLA